MYRAVLLLSLFLIASHNVVIAQHHGSETTRTTGSVDLGKIEFPTSAPPEAQKHFIEGVLLLHSFEYSRARRAFQEASKVAPDFALAYWGEAMTYDHPIWPEYDRPGALAVLARLGPTPEVRRAKAPTEREKMYLDAVEKLFADGDQKQVAAEYSAAMERLTKRFPEDLEAQAFYSLSILGLTRTTRNTENYMRAAAVAEAVYKKNPLHPGALHYLIHSYDDPAHASLGLRAARAYGTVARSASHAQHMPSHIFFALGLWDDSIAANTASMKTARAEGNGGYHPLHWLLYSYLQVGRIDEATKLLGVIEEDSKTITSAYNRNHLAMCQAMMLVETRGSGPASLMTLVDTSGARSFSTSSNLDLATGLEYVRRNDLVKARGALETLRTRIASTNATPDSTNRYATVLQSDIDQAGVMQQILQSAVQFADGERDVALKNVVAAAEAEDRLVFEYGPPAIVKPAWEQAGEMFLAAGKKSEAADAFRKALKRYPNRKLSNEGLKAATGS
jgi:tetratricopeptide (TPR) repeat protein